MLWHKQESTCTKLYQLCGFSSKIVAIVLLHIAIFEIILSRGLSRSSPILFFRDKFGILTILDLSQARVAKETF